MTYTLAEVTADPTILDEVEGELRSLRYRAALLEAWRDARYDRRSPSRSRRLARAGAAAGRRSNRLALLWQILCGTGFPNQFFGDSWVVGFWRGRPWLARYWIGVRSSDAG